MAQDQHPDTRPAVSTNAKREGMAGIITKTIVQTPVVRWILHARIRNGSCNDVVFVGDDFIHVKQVRGPGTLQHIATKDDFDGRIRAAKSFSNYKEAADEDLFVKIENGSANVLMDSIPPQCLILSLDTNDFIFLWLDCEANGTLRFVQQACPMPTFDRLLFQPGEHLAVDSQSRAMAVAASEREVVIYSAKSKEKIQDELLTRDPDWCLVSAQRPLKIPGVIQKMDFLIPPLNDQGTEDEDHVILLLIVTDQQKTRAVWIDWYASSDLHNAQVHTGQPLDVAKCVPSLLVPLRNAAFLLIHGTEIKRWKDILSGSASSSVLDVFPTEASHPGAAPRQPVWANWCRPKRGQATRGDTDHVYLVREDGNLYLIQITPDKVEISHAGTFHCHVGTACASLGDSRDPDILAVAGDMSNGSVQSIGSWFTPLDIPEVSRRSWAEMEWIETIPNWASVTDIVVSSLSGRSQRPRDGVFVTSCRQPYGTVTELRHGIEAGLSAYFELDGLKSVTDIWALPFSAVGRILVFLSSPTGTRLLDISPDAAMETIEEVDDSTIGLDSTHRTLAASITTGGKIVQITEKAMCLTSGFAANFEDSAKVECEGGIVAAAIDTSYNVAIAAMRSDGGQSSFKLQSYRLLADDLSILGDSQINQTTSITLTSEPLSLALVPFESKVTALVATADSYLTAFGVDPEGSLMEISKNQIPASLDGPGLCDSITTLKADSSALAVCGLRDGRIYTVKLEGSDQSVFAEGNTIPFSQSTVRVSQPSNEHSFAYAMSGADTCQLTWDGTGASSLNIQSVWISDRLRPELAQGAIVACTHMPSAHLLTSADLAGSLIMISGDEFLVASLDEIPGAVPRQIPVSGTPDRLIYSEQQRCLVCASSRYEVRQFPSNHPHAKPEERRQIWPVIDFLPSRSSAPSYTYDLQPGSRVFALLEWSFKVGEDKTYSFILVGGSYTRSSGAQRGRILFLQPVNRSWEVVDVKEGRAINFDAPVYALAVYQETKLVACIGQNVVVLNFDAEERKWKQACAPLKLASVGVHVSVAGNGNDIHISTLQDGVVNLRLVENRQSDEEYDLRLDIKSMAPRADYLLSHVAVSTHETAETLDDSGIVLASTKYGQLLGLQMNGADNRHSNSADLLFEAQLPRSLTRLRQCHIRPRWKPHPPTGMKTDNIIGCCADGAINGIGLLDEDLWRRLSWLQRLCEWSQDLSPLSYQVPPYSVGEGTYARNERVMPIGLRSERKDEVVMRTERDRLVDRHIDGDILARLLKQNDPVGSLKDVLKQVAARSDRAGDWVRSHLEEESAAVEETVDMLKRVLESWM